MWPRHPVAVSIAGALALATLAFAAGAGADEADPPGRVARVNLLDGRGALQLAGTETWADDLLSRPLTGGDRLWIESGSRAEMHIGSVALRLGASTALQLLIVDDQHVRLRLTAGSVTVRIRDLDAGDHFEFETPQGTISLLEPGGYRLDVDERDERTRLAVWSGGAEVSKPSDTREVGTDEGAELFAGDSMIKLTAAGATDDLDLWAEDRDGREDQSHAARYVSRDVVGYEELDGYGDWVSDPVYGSVWVPQVVIAGWAPYRFGYWNWIGPWGWTWIDDAPWGFAPCHYGRWVYAHYGWAWAPGVRGPQRPVYAPALVAWRGGLRPANDARHAPGVGWVPLGYNEIYEPPFHASRGYWRATNLSNTHIGYAGIHSYIARRQGGDGDRAAHRFANESVPGAYTEALRDTFSGATSASQNRPRPASREPRQAPFGAGSPEIRPDLSSLGHALPVDRPVSAYAYAYPPSERGALRVPAAPYDSQRRAAPPPHAAHGIDDAPPAYTAPAAREPPPAYSAPAARENRDVPNRQGDRNSRQ